MLKSVSVVNSIRLLYVIKIIKCIFEKSSNFPFNILISITVVQSVTS